MELFRPNLFNSNDYILYLDLDTVVVGEITNIIDEVYRFPWIVLSDFYAPEQMASGIMAWYGRAMRRVWEDFWKDHTRIMRQHPKRMDQYLRIHLHHAYRFQDLLPGQIVSYKADIRGQREPHRRIVIPEDARLVCFHGTPTPADLSVDNPVRRAWGR